MSKQNTQYNAEQIQVLEGLEPVRKRPGMYIGGTGVEGLHHLIWEVVDNSFDEAMAGHADLISVTLYQNGWVKVEDNGRGIPVDKVKATGKSALETVLTVLHAGGKFGGGGYKVSGGLHGVGVSVVNALSTDLVAEVKLGGKLHRQVYKDGVPEQDLKVIGKADGTGTTISFKANPEIFETTEFSFQTVLERLRQRAYLTKKIKVDLAEELTDGSFRRYSFYFEGGIKSYVDHLNRSRNTIHPDVFYVEKKIDDTEIEVSLQYNDSYVETVKTFANNIYTKEGGTHLTGFRSSLTRVINDYAKKNKLIKDNETLTGDDVREGLTVVISVRLPEPQFEGQTKAKLGTPEIRSLVENTTTTYFSYFLDENPDQAKKIISKVSLSAKARLAARAARDTVIRKGALDGLTLPGKLADCNSKDPSKCEIYLIEGDSAAGSVKGARDSKYQALLPLRGKVLNVERARLDRMLSSDAIKNMIVALGTGIGDSFDLTKLRYHRIIIMTDADVDGSHIRTLLLTLFFRHLPEVIEAGYLYIALPPLYKITYNRKVYYAYTEAERTKVLGDIKDSASQASNSELEVEVVLETPDLSKVDVSTAEELAELALESQDTSSQDQGNSEEVPVSHDLPKGVSVSRYKGLGEMNPDQLWETTMDPKNRILLKVNIEDAEKADRVFHKLMGDEVILRRNFIQSRAKEVSNLDI
ncbi:DNA topoisomerase (ATP-hydrolyzing) subunit B [Candidatus Saccharibacteria bacterium]|nr:DNA topoisomerase (ATP-hydrolyzing) subunit B [Candidatus Saccharibacteria bacterium]